MRSYLTRISLAFLSICGAAVADEADDGAELNHDCCATELNLDCCSPYVSLYQPTYTFDVEFAALLLLPMSNNLSYAVETVPLPLASPHWLIYDIEPTYHFGFDVGARVFCYQRNTNVILNWEHFHSKDSASKVVPSGDNDRAVF